jgi:hypothetical protein
LGWYFGLVLSGLTGKARRYAGLFVSLSIVVSWGN